MSFTATSRHLRHLFGTCVEHIMSADNKIGPVMVPSADFFVAYPLPGAFRISICIIMLKVSSLNLYEVL